ncbi:hypothetical protein AB0D32_05190 [Micromonospora sp. NPDC048170]|uniref:hypothetical protein n=1 Tax=Micromonospora sp. NPDC048170 TaxID=3154819 RepID=UPI00340AFB55
MREWIDPERARITLSDHAERWIIQRLCLRRAPEQARGPDGPDGSCLDRAALIYQHTARERDEHIADALSSQIKQSQNRARDGHGRRKKRQQRMRPQPGNLP